MERRIIDEKSTIPKPSILAGVVTSTNNASKLRYTGSNDVADIYGQSKISAVDSPSWIWVNADVAPYLAQVTGLWKVDDEDYTIYLDRDFGTVTNAECHYVTGAIKYGYLVDGDADIQVCSGDKGSELITVLQSESDGEKAPYQLYVQRTKLHPPLYVDATNSNVLVNEET